MKKLFVILFVLSAASLYVSCGSRPSSVTESPDFAPEGFVRINSGTFTMGSPANETGHYYDEGPQRQVTVSSFFMGKYEVTQKEWFDVMGTTIRQQQAASGPTGLAGEGNNYPMYYVSWFEVVEYCNRRSQRENLTPVYTISGTGDNRTVTWNRNANGYRLPTEAEWEYACRAGTVTSYWSGNNETTLAGKANAADLTLKDMAGEQLTSWINIRDGYALTSPVGSFQANAWGLFDMHGNVWEWCWDWYGNYPSGAQTDPVGASSGSLRVLRGGGWYFPALHARSASRFFGSPIYRSRNFGFRVVRPIQ